MTIGDKIKKLRKLKGLTQTELGKRVGVKKNAVSKWECGRVEDIPTSTIKVLSKLFDVPISYLLDNDGVTEVTIAKNIRYLRKKQGWGQDVLAEKLGYKSYTTIQKWESGASEPPLKTVHVLADLFHVDINDLTISDLEQREAFESGNQSEGPDKSGELDPDEERLLEGYHRLNQQGKGYMLQTLAMVSRAYTRTDIPIKFAEDEKFSCYFTPECIETFEPPVESFEVAIVQSTRGKK